MNLTRYVYRVAYRFSAAVMLVIVPTALTAQAKTTTSTPDSLVVRTETRTGTLLLGTVYEELRKAGAEPLSIGETGYRQISNSKRPIVKPEDLKGAVVATELAVVLMNGRPMRSPPIHSTPFRGGCSRRVSAFISWPAASASSIRLPFAFGVTRADPVNANVRAVGSVNVRSRTVSGSVRAGFRPTRWRAPGGSFIWPKTSIVLSMTPASFISSHRSLPSRERSPMRSRWCAMVRT